MNNETQFFITKATDYDLTIKPLEEFKYHNCFEEGDLLFVEKKSEEKVGYFSISPSPSVSVRGCTLVQLNFLIKKLYQQQDLEKINPEFSPKIVEFINKWNFVGCVSQVNKRGQTIINNKIEQNNIYGLKVRLNTIAKIKNYAGVYLNEGDEFILARILVNFKKDEWFYNPLNQTTKKSSFANDFLIPQYVLLTNLNEQSKKIEDFHESFKLEQPTLTRIGKMCRTTMDSLFSGFSGIDASFCDNYIDHQFSETKKEAIGKQVELWQINLPKIRLLNIILD